MASTTDYINLTLYQDESSEDTVTFDTTYAIEGEKLIARIGKDFSATAFTGDDDAGVLVAYVINNVGAAYTDGTYALVISGGTITDATGTVTIANGIVTTVSITDGGSGYTSQPTVTIGGSPGTPTTAADISLIPGVAGYLTLNGKSEQDAAGDTYTISLSNTKTGALPDDFSGYWDLVGEDSTGKTLRHMQGEVFLEKSITKISSFT